jgi:hypothetical protein
MSEIKPQTYLTNDFENLNLSIRDVKGFNFESRVDSVLNDIGITYLSNPLDNIKEWKSRQGRGSDFKILSWNWELEAKYSDSKVFPSWIDRDWIPRFKNGTFRVTVHNRGMKLSSNSLERCFIHDIYLVEIDYLRYLLKAEIKARSRGNKLLEAKNSKKQNTKRENTEKQKQSGEIEGLELISSKSSATFKEISFDSKEIFPKNVETGNVKVKTRETNSSTLNDYTVVPSEPTTEKCSSFSSTSREYSVPPSGKGRENCSSLIHSSSGEANGSKALGVFYENNVDVERQNFIDETLSRYPSINKNRIKSPKECPNRKYMIIVCSQKVFRPRYLCPFRVFYLKRHQRFPSYIEKYGKIYMCKNPECTGEICKVLDLTCSFLVEIHKCPRMYKPPHFCLPLPKPEILPSPDLTYYLNLKQNDVMK